MSRCAHQNRLWRRCHPLVMLLATLMAWPVIAEPANGRLKLSIIDAATGQTVPARVAIRDDHGHFYIADDALLIGGDCDVYRDDHVIYSFDRALARLGKSIKNISFDQSTEYFYSTGQSEISLPSGPIKIQVFKGPEYNIAEAEVRITAGHNLEYSVSLTRIANMPSKGWYSADDHLHIARSVEALNPFVSKMMQAEDLHVANLLQMGKEQYFAIAPQYAYGPEGQYREGNYILASGQENPRTHILGHAITLGAQAPFHEPENNLIYRHLWEKAVAQGGINGYAHYGNGSHGEQFGLAVVLPHDLMRFIEVLGFNLALFETWYEVLNLGFRVAATAGTDYPCGSSVPGHERFYTKVKGQFNFDNWLEGVRQGRTFVTTGALLEFTINGQDIGSEIVLTEPGSVLIEGKIRFNTLNDQFERIELIENGRVVLSLPRQADAGEIHFKTDYKVQESAWFALRGYHNERAHKLYYWTKTHGSIVHSSPIYITVQDTLPINRQPRAKAIAKTWLARLQELEIRVMQADTHGLIAQLNVGEDRVSLENFRQAKSRLLQEIATAKRFFRRYGR